MKLPSRSAFTELRRLLPLSAAALLLVALWFPMWRIEMHAVQYPNEVLRLALYAYPRISGDYVEIARLNSYIGFYYPDPVYWQPNYEPHPRAIDVPEWSLGPLAFVGVAATGVFVAVAPTVSKLKKGLTAQLVCSVLVFGVLLADIQYRLYQAGHSLDPDAPVIGVDGFTPPLWGKYAVANITSYSSFGLGAYLTMLAIGLLVVAWLARDSTVTVEEVPARLRALPEQVRERRRIVAETDTSTTECVATETDTSTTECVATETDTSTTEEPGERVSQ